MSKIVLNHITLAAVNVPAMVKFYNEVFAADLHASGGYSSNFYRGKLGGIDLLLCPNEVAEVVAEQGRHQLHFQVADLDNMVETAVSAGGRVHTAITRSGDLKTAVLYDPDGNTVELAQQL